MKQPRNYFVFNKPSDYRRSWCDNLPCTGGTVTLTDSTRPGILWSRLLDSREKETDWHRMTMESHCRGAASVRFSFYCAESDTVIWQETPHSLGQLLRDEALTDEDRLRLSAPWLVRTALNPTDILLEDVKGRYLWFRAELVAEAGESPEIGNLMLQFPRETWLSYLPEVYQADPAGSSFTRRFLGIFQSLYSDLDEEIRHVARYLDPDVAAGPYLEWLASWLDVEDRYLWPEDKLRELVRRGMELYRIRGTRQYVVEMVRLYTGQEPWVVEYSEVEPFLSDVRRADLLHRLYGDTPYMVTVILDESALESNDSYKALLRIIDNARPAWIEVNLIRLSPYLFLDQYSYLGINSRLDRYRPLDLNGSSALPFTRLGGESEQDIS